MSHELEQPFFARFLESQDYVPIETGIKAGPGGGHGGGGGGSGGGGGGGPPLITMKYPSDDDEGGGVTV